MKILWVVPFIPYPPNDGGRMRMYYLLKHLAKNHDISIFAPVINDSLTESEGVKEYCRYVYTAPYPVSPRIDTLNYLINSVQCWRAKPYIFYKFAPKNVRQVFRDIIQQESFDIIEFVNMQTTVFYNEIPGSSTPNRILTLFDVETDRIHSFFQVERNLANKLGYYFQWLQVKRYEFNILSQNKFSWIFNVSEKERNALTERFPHLVDHISLASNGVDCFGYDFAKSFDQNLKKQQLVFIGSMDYVVNQDAVLWFVQEILPHIHKKMPDVNFTIVGKNPPASITALSSPNITITGTVPDVRPYLQQATAVVVPLRAGGGTRLKILEAMAAGVPVVSTTKGAEGLAVEHGKHLLLTDSPVDFASQTVALLQNVGLQQQLTKAGRTLVEDRYDWSKIAEHVDEIYQQIAASN